MMYSKFQLQQSKENEVMRRKKASGQEGLTEKKRTVRNNLSCINKKFHPRRDDNEQAEGWLHLRVPDMTASLTSFSQQRQQRYQGKERKKQSDRQRIRLFQARHSFRFQRLIQQSFSSFFSSPSNQQIVEATWQAITKSGTEKARKKKEKICGGGCWKLRERERGRW